MRFFQYPTFDCCRGQIVSFRITKLSLHNINTYTYPLQKLLYRTQGGGNFDFKFGFVFRQVYIFSDFVQILFAPTVVNAGQVRQET